MILILTQLKILNETKHGQSSSYVLYFIIKLTFTKAYNEFIISVVGGGLFDPMKDKRISEFLTLTLTLKLS